MLEYLHAVGPSGFTGPGAAVFAEILRHRINSHGRADLSPDSDKHIDALYHGLLRVAAASGCHWRSGIDLDTGRIAVQLQPGEVDHDACATDMQYGYNTFGLPEGMASAAPVLDRGGVVVLACPDCERFKRAHALQIRMVDGRYIVTPA